MVEWRSFSTDPFQNAQQRVSVIAGTSSFAGIPDEGLPEAVDPLAASLPAEAVASCAQYNWYCETHSNAADMAKQKF